MPTPEYNQRKTEPDMQIVWVRDTSQVNMSVHVAFCQRHKRVIGKKKSELRALLVCGSEETVYGHVLGEIGRTTCSFRLYNAPLTTSSAVSLNPPAVTAP